MVFCSSADLPGRSGSENRTEESCLYFRGQIWGNYVVIIGLVGLGCFVREMQRSVAGIVDNPRGIRNSPNLCKEYRALTRSWQGESRFSYNNTIEFASLRVRPTKPVDIVPLVLCNPYNLPRNLVTRSLSISWLGFW